MTHQIGGCTLHPLRGTYSIGVFKSSLVPISLGLVLLLSFLCSHVPRAYASPHPRSYSYPIQLSNGTSGPTTASTYPNTRISTSMNAGSPIQKRVEGDEFDFVIVGGGTAGLVIAERLSRDPNVSIAVLEAGYDAESDTTLVPELYTTFIGTSIDWKFTTVPQTNAAGQVISLPRGKALGGTSTVNGMYFVRASQKEYDAWETLGNPGWNFASVNAHINAVEHFHVASVSPPNTPADALTFEALDSPWNHGHTGAIQVSYSNYWSIPEVVIPAYLRSLNKLGVPRNGHAANGDTIGAWQAPCTIKPHNRSRSYAANEFLFPYTTSRPNLQVFTGAYVTKIDTKIDLVATSGDEDVDATAVEYVLNDDTESETRSVSLKDGGKVVVTAGTYQTPKILELSGIGDPSVLGAFGISNVVDLPGVGNNLQDHAAILTSFELIPSLGTSGPLTQEDLARNATFAAQQWQTYVNESQGAYASVPGTTLAMIPLQSFISAATLESMLEELDAALGVYDGTPQETQIALQRGWLEDRTVPQVELVLLPGLMDPSIIPDPSKHHITIAAVYMRPFSRGNVHLASTDPLALPRIDPNYLAIQDFEVGVLREAVRFIVDTLATTAPLSSLIGAALNPTQGQTDAQLDVYVKEGVFSSWHPCGSTSMLPLNQGGVVDPNLKVYGTSNVYIADASIIPLEIVTHTMATVYANAHKAADILTSS